MEYFSNNKQITYTFETLHTTANLQHLFMTSNNNFNVNTHNIIAQYRRYVFFQYNTFSDVIDLSLTKMENWNAFKVKFSAFANPAPLKKTLLKPNWFNDIKKYFIWFYILWKYKINFIIFSLSWPGHLLQSAAVEALICFGLFLVFLGVFSVIVVALSSSCSTNCFHSFLLLLHQLKHSHHQ